MWSLFKKRSRKPEGMSCIAINQAGIAYAHVVPGEDNYGIKFCDFLPCEDESKRSSVLKEYVFSNNLSGSNCTYVLQPKDYRLILIDLPEVVEDEIKNAARWAVADFIDFPIEEAAIDIFQIPSTSGGKKKLYVIVTRLSLLKDISLLVFRAGLNLVRVDITELALTHAMNLFHDDKEGVGLVCLTQDGVHLLMTKENTLCWERRIFVTGNIQENEAALQAEGENNDSAISNKTESAEGDEFLFVDNEAVGAEGVSAGETESEEIQVSQEDEAGSQAQEETDEKEEIKNDQHGVEEAQNETQKKDEEFVEVETQEQGKKNSNNNLSSKQANAKEIIVSRKAQQQEVETNTEKSKSDTEEPLLAEQIAMKKGSKNE